MELPELKQYFDGNRRHAGYKLQVQLCEELTVHAEGRYPVDAIEERRPSENEAIQAYRKTIFVPLAKETLSQIVTAYGKIRRSPDWSIQFPKELPQGVVIAKGETLEEYTMRNYPLGQSIEFWAFSTLLKTYLLDAGAVVLVVPLQEVIKENEYLKPIPVIYHAEQVLEYDELQGLLILREEQEEDATDLYKAFTVVDNQRIVRYKNSDNGYRIIGEYKHGLGILPAFKVPGRFMKSYKRYTLNESPIQVIAARLKEFVREYSDNQAEVVQHIHSETAVWASLPCQTCNKGGVSLGKVIDKKTSKETICPTCQGNAYVATSPYKQIVVRPSRKAGPGVEQDAPWPPKVHITKPVEIVKIQDERCEKHLYKCLEALNMQFLMKTPANQSGYAKDVDAQELQNNVYAVAEDMVWCQDRLFFLTAEYRYRVTIKNAEARKALCPEIPVPEKYDLLSSVYLLDDITKAQTAKINPMVINAMQIELVKKKFYYAPNERDFLVAALTLDPLPGLSEDDKMIRLQNGGATETAYIISSNIYPFLRKAIDEDSKFLSKPDKQKVEVLQKYAAETMSTMGSVLKQQQQESAPA